MGARSERAANSFENAVQIFRYVIVPESKNLVSVLVQDARASIIALALGIVLPAVQFDRQLALWEREVGNVFTDWVLTSSLYGKSRLAQRQPEFLLNFGRVVPQPTRGARPLPDFALHGQDGTMDFLRGTRRCNLTRPQKTTTG